MGRFLLLLCVVFAEMHVLLGMGLASSQRQLRSSSIPRSTLTSGENIDFSSPSTILVSQENSEHLRSLKADYEQAVVAITTRGRLLLMTYGKETLAVDAPTEIVYDGKYEKLRFMGNPTIIGHVTGKKTIFVLTTEGRLAQVSGHGQAWRMDFPAEYHDRNIRFENGIAAWSRSPTTSNLLHKSVFAVTTTGKLAQVYADPYWKLDFPSELAGKKDQYFGGVAVLAYNAKTNLKAIYAVQTDGRLAMFWDYSGNWRRGYPAEQVGHLKNLRFQGGVYTRPMKENHDQQIYAYTKDGHMVELKYKRGRGWGGSYYYGFQFKGTIGLLAEGTETYAIKKDGNLAYIYQKGSEQYLKSSQGQTFKGDGLVVMDDAKSIFALTADGRLAHLVKPSEGLDMEMTYPIEAIADERFEGGLAAIGEFA